jgi:hypothetical protein
MFESSWVHEVKLLSRNVLTHPPRSRLCADCTPKRFFLLPSSPDCTSSASRMPFPCLPGHHTCRSNTVRVMLGHSSCLPGCSYTMREVV